MVLFIATKTAATKLGHILKFSWERYQFLSKINEGGAEKFSALKKKKSNNKIEKKIENLMFGNLFRFWEVSQDVNFSAPHRISLYNLSSHTLAGYQ